LSSVSFAHLVKKKVQGVATERDSMNLDLKCYSCNADWEKVIVDRKE